MIQDIRDKKQRIAGGEMKKSNLGILLVICLMILLISPLLGQAEKTKVKVIVNVANVRLKPDLGSQVIGKIPLGTILEFDQTIGEWFRVTLPPDESGFVIVGYMHNSVVERIVEEPVKEIEKKEVQEKEEPKKIEEPEKPARPPSIDSKKPLVKENKLKIGLQGSAGTTIVDLVKVTDYDEPILREWDTFHYQIKLQALHKIGSIESGLEVGHNKLYWYYLRIPYGTQWIYRERLINTINVYALLQHTLPNAIFFQAGAGVHFFHDGISLGFMSTAGYEFRLSEKLSVPIFARIDLILGDGTPIPLSLGAGIRYHMPGLK